MIVDMGGGTTEVAVVSLGDMVVSKSLDVAGDELDEAIIQYFRRKYNLLIGETSAEEMKIKIGSVFPLPEEQVMEVKGRDQVTGLPKTVTITSEEVRQALADPIKLIIEVIKQTLEETPAELAADLVDTGIVLAGGGALATRTARPVVAGNGIAGCHGCGSFDLRGHGNGAIFGRA